MQKPKYLCVATLVLALVAVDQCVAKERILRAGIIGCDTSHVVAFTKLINNPKATGPLAGVRITAAFPGGSPDIPASHDRLSGFVKKLRASGIKIVGSLDELADQCDVFMVESVDGRPHLKQFRAVAKGKPVFIDKPMAASLADVLAIFRVADETHTPVYSSSSLRFVKEIQEAAHDESIGELLGCATQSPMSIERFHPDLFFYGIHGVEPLFAIMGPGCESVSRTESPLSTVVVGKWKDGRIGSYRGIKKGYYYSLTVFGTKHAVQWTNAHPGYEQAVNTMCEFFETGKPPVSREETIEIFAFMEAADASKKAGGKPVKLADIIKRAKEKSAVISASSGGGE